MSYEKLTKINKLHFEDKRVLIIGAGSMAQQYCKSLSAMKVENVTVISRREESSRRCCQNYNYKSLSGGYRDNLPKLGIFDLVIVATPIHELKPAANFAISRGNKNILVEKPGALYSTILNDWADETENSDVRIRIGYNRYTYPSLWKLKEIIKDEGEITSCFYTFTEWVHTIDFKNNQPEVYKRWGIANSLHLISMAHHLIGMPREISTYQFGSLPWHPSGAQFVGAGITEKNILFSYQADWNSAGRWGIEIMTPDNAYRLIPLEKLYHCPKTSINWKQIELVSAYPQVKEGIAEEIAVMLDRELERYIPLVTLKEAVFLTRLAENVFGYSSKP